MNKKMLLSTLTVVGTVAFAWSAFAFMWNGWSFWSRNLNNANQEQVREAIENWNFSAFQTATSGSNRFTQMTEEKFNEMFTRKKERQEHREKIQKTMDDVDFESWKSIQDNEYILSIIDTEETITLLFTFIYLPLYGSDISATFVKPEPDNSPIISRTLP